MDNKLPNGWTITNLDDVSRIVTGNTPSMKSPENYGGNVPWVKPPDLSKNVEIFKTEQSLSVIGAKQARLLPKGAVLVSCIGNLGNVAIAGVELATNQQINSAVFYKGIVNAKYGYYWCSTLKPWLYENATSTTISMVNKTKFSKAPFLLAPLPEQKRIVAKLDKLFGHLDHLKARLELVPQLMKDFRQSVLTQAVSGKLTEEWREGKELEEWNVDNLANLSSSRLGKMLDKNKNKGKLTDYLRNVNIRWFSIDLNDISQLRIEESELEKYELNPHCRVLGHFQ